MHKSNSQTDSEPSIRQEENFHDIIDSFILSIWYFKSGAKIEFIDKTSYYPTIKFLHCVRTQQQIGEE